MGLGFNSVYHLTDAPFLISEDKFIFFFLILKQNKLNDQYVDLMTLVYIFIVLTKDRSLWTVTHLDNVLFTMYLPLID